LWRRWRWPRWWCSFLDELWLDVGRRRRLRQRNIFWRWRGLRWRQGRLDDLRRLRRKLYCNGLALLS
jgi:hypothetical protein